MLERFSEILVRFMVIAAGSPWSFGERLTASTIQPLGKLD
jgi:hypothetical protein